MARLWAVTGVTVISFSAIFVRLAAVAPSTAAFFRASYALPFLLGIWLWQRGARQRSARARVQALVAGVFLGLDLAFWHRAIELIGAGLATVLGNTQVVFVGIFAWWIYRERPSRAAVAAVPVVFAGVTLISGLGSGEAFGENPWLGVAFGMLTGITYSVFLLIYRAAGRDLGSPAGPLLDATLGAALGSLAVGLIDGHLELAVTWPAHGWLLALALGSQVVGWQLIGAALPRLPALETSVVLLLQPMLTMVWAWLMFAERVSALQGAGIALVLGGVGWLSVKSAARNAAGPREERPAFRPLRPPAAKTP